MHGAARVSVSVEAVESVFLALVRFSMLKFLHKLICCMKKNPQFKVDVQVPSRGKLRRLVP